MSDAPARAPAAAADAPVTHRHAWDAMRFELTDDHAWVVETCATCGQIRRYRAFERFWAPGSAESRG